ncbi:DUF2789 domain-containing protein [Moraxella sp. Tifton1]|uniref:DUF2789 family protein n=1 Tax=Moraxella oculi TaxID=2940516 RepID=A0ABW8U7A3_9GAMM|nr:DUF2789 family protein [Moraxella sp. Tifton1]MCL1623561.1 DUF2789 domain-containing protein [Moraxella sp. Tifton1]
MLGEVDYTLNQLFKQLGLDNSDAAIDSFIRTNQLSQQTMLIDAPFWNEQQRSFLKEEYKLDSVWSLTIDELNTLLHEDAMSN